MARLSMNEMTTYRWSFEEDILNYASAGLDGVSVWRQKLSDFGEERGIDLIAESGLDVASLMWAGGFTGSDGRSYKEAVQDAKDAIRLAGELHAGALLVYSGARAGHTHAHARRLLKNGLTEIAPFACEHGVAIGLEPMHEGCASEWTFLTNLDETLELIDNVDCSQLKLVFDCYHLACDTEILGRLPDLVNRVAIVQLGDAKRAPCGEQDRCRLGHGKVPLREIVRAFIDAGYGGYFDIELMGEELENSNYTELIQQSKEAFNRLVDTTSA